MALLVTASQFLAHLDADKAAIGAETDRINALPEGSIDNATLLSYSRFLDQFASFDHRTRAKASGANVIVAPVMNADDDTLIVFERNLRAFQDKFAALGFPATAPMVPRDSPDHPANEPGHGGIVLPSFPSISDAVGLGTGEKIAIGVGIGAVALFMLRR